MTVPDIGANLAALEELSSEDRVKRLWKTDDTSKGLKDMGFNIGHSETPITPVIIGEATEAKKFSARPLKRSLCRRYYIPHSAYGDSSHSVMVSAAHTKEDLILPFRNSSCWRGNENYLIIR